MRRALPLLVAGAVACGGRAVPSRPSPSPQPPAPDAGAAPARPGAAKVLRQRVELTLDPSLPDFSGSVEIDLAIAEPVPALYLRAAGLEIDAATAGGHPARTAVSAGDEAITVTPAQPLPAGETTLALRFHGHLGKPDAPGLYQSDRAVFAAFDFDGARHAFPCFDDASVKIPWSITLVVPRGETALATSAVLHSTDEEAGKKRVVFAETRPLPAQMISLAVGPFEMVSAGAAGKQAVKLRFAVPRGRSAEIKTAAEMLPRLLVELEALTGTPYPYGKVDVVLVPRADGGDQAGLLTLPTDVLVAPEAESLGRQQAVAGILAHVLAHQWIGNLVSRRDMNDPWLEALTLWLGRRALARIEPSWRIELTRIIELGEEDPARRGAEVVQALSGWAGTDRFDAALRDFLAEFADKVVPLGALLLRTDAEFARLAPELAQAPAPLVEARLACAARQPARLVLDTASDVAVPVCAGWPRAVGGGRARACTIVRRHAELALGDAPGCPPWVVANDGADGVHRAGYPRELLGALIKAAPQLAPAERLALVRDARVLVRAGRLPLGDALPLVPALAGDEAPEVVDATVALLGDLRRQPLPPELEAAFRRLVARLYGKRARALGWSPRPGEPADATRVRPVVLMAAGGYGADRDVARGAEAVVLAALTRRDAVDPALSSVAFRVVGGGGSRQVFEKLRMEARATDDPRVRQQLMSALGRFDDLDLANATLALLLEIDPAVAPRTLSALLETPTTRDLAWSFFREHAADLLGRAPPDAALALLALPGVLCDEPRRAAAETLLRDQAAKIEGGADQLRMSLARAAECIGAARREAPAVARFLRGQR